MVNLIWLATVGWAASRVWPLVEVAVWMKVVGIGVLALPAVAGLVLSARLTKDFDRFLIAMLWTSLAVAVTAAGGGISGLGVILFPLAPAVAAAYGDREAVIKASAVALMAFAVTLALDMAGFIQPAPQMVDFHMPFVLGALRGEAIHAAGRSRAITCIARTDA